MQYADYNFTDLKIINIENKEKTYYPFEWQEANANGVYDDGELCNTEMSSMKYLKYKKHNNFIKEDIYEYNTET